MNEVVDPEQKPSGISADTKAAMAFETSKKSTLISYLLWFFLGGFGAHRFYLGRTGSAIGMLVLLVLSSILAVVAIGALGFIALAIWIIVDAFLIPGIAKSYNQELISRIESGLGE